MYLTVEGQTRTLKSYRCVTDPWQWRTVDLFGVLQKLNKQGNVLQTRCFHLLGLFIQNTYTLQRPVGISEGRISSKTTAKDKDKGFGMSLGINKTIIGLRGKKKKKIIQMRRSVPKHWLWKPTLIQIQIIRALAEGSIPGNPSYPLKEAQCQRLKKGLKCTVCTCKAV